MVKEFNDGLVKVYHSEVNKIKLEVVMDVVVDEVVDKEVTKVKKLVQEVNEGLVLVCRCGDGCRGDYKVGSGGTCAE